MLKEVSQNFTCINNGWKEHCHIMFLASNICCVNSGTVNARYCWEPRDVSGAKPFMKKCLWSVPPVRNIFEDDR